ncbi:MAG: hypothetical protein ACI814_002267, partial [Mariniblastus sp.]
RESYDAKIHGPAGNQNGMRIIGALDEHPALNLERPDFAPRAAYATLGLAGALLILTQWFQRRKSIAD